MILKSLPSLFNPPNSTVDIDKLKKDIDYVAISIDNSKIAENDYNL